ncbi:MAG: hypothetical protein HY332_24040 [Chloroflexi bacterium]|nr:hypothetical protein [Chloroflexota bacterium]
MPNVAELIKDDVTLAVDCVDRLYLNAYVPRLQSSGGVVTFLEHPGQAIPSPAILGQITETFKRGLRAWAERDSIPWLEFRKGERKDDVVQPYRERFTATGAAEGRVLVGVAQDMRDALWRLMFEHHDPYTQLQWGAARYLKGPRGGLPKDKRPWLSEHLANPDHPYLTKQPGW